MTSARPSAATATRWTGCRCPQYVVSLGETELAAGKTADARRDFGLVGAEERLLQANGVNTDVDLALFEASHGSPASGGHARAPRLG